MSEEETQMNAAKPEERDTATSDDVNHAILSGGIPSALDVTDPSSSLIPTNENSETGRKRKKVVFCKNQGCTSYSREGGYCIKHGGGKRCTKNGCETRCYALGFCFKHGNEVYNSSEYEEHHSLKKAKCKRCSKSFMAPTCFFSTMLNVGCKNMVQGKQSSIFCEIHSRQMLLALKEQESVTLKDFELPNFAETKNLKKSTCYSNKKRLCDFDGCKSLARKRGKCQRHAVRAICSIENCSGKAQSRGLCGHHGGGKRCKFTKCFKVAKIGSKYCAKHSEEESGTLETPTAPSLDEEASDLLKQSTDNDMVLPDIKSALV